MSGSSWTPSGIFDVDEFFDVLRDEPLDRWYQLGNVIAIVDALLPEDFPRRQNISSLPRVRGRAVSS